MADHINRSAGWDGVAAAYGNLLADLEWRAEYEELLAQLPQQERILILLKSRMKQMGAAEFMPDFQIQHPTMDRVKMRLVLGTGNGRAVEVLSILECLIE